MENFVWFVKNWGYLAVFLGSLVEGESVILTASAMASFGHLSIWKIMIIAFIGTLIADQFLYYVGRLYGATIFDKWPALRKSTEKAFKLLNKYDVLFIILCRFIFGVRITSAVVIGASGIPPTRFTPLNVLSAAVWTVISCTGGYLLGETMEKIMHYLTAIDLFPIRAGFRVS